VSSLLPAVLEAERRSIEEMRLVKAFCRFVELAERPR
jgi:hypothetical protein